MKPPQFRSGLENWVLVGVGAVLLAIFWSVLCTVPGVPWNAARLAPSFALARGLPIYVLRDAGAHLGWIYGPVFPLYFLPVGFFENPTIGLMLAAVMNLVALLLPLFATVRVALGCHTRAAVLTTLLGTVLLLAHPVTHNAFYMLHVDALCVACGLLACASLHAGVKHAWRPGLPLAALALALAVGTKQISIVLVPAMTLWLWREGHRRLVFTWFFWLVVLGGGLAGLFFFIFGPEQLVFNVWLFPARAPRGNARMGLFFLKTLLLQSWMWWVALGLGWLGFRTVAKELAPATKSFLRLIGWAVLMQAPMGIFAAVRAGGGLNSMHALSYMLVPGLVVVGAWLAKRGEGWWPSRQMRPGFAVGAIVLLGLAADCRLVFARDIVWRPYRGLEELLATARRTPGKIYLPWNPLITIISDHKVYPFDDALYCLWLAKLEPPRAAIRAAVPANSLILYQDPSQSHFALNYFGPEARAAADPKREP